MERFCTIEEVDVDDEKDGEEGSRYLLQLAGDNEHRFGIRYIPCRKMDNEKANRRLAFLIRQKVVIRLPTFRLAAYDSGILI